MNIQESNTRALDAILKQSIAARHFMLSLHIFERTGGIVTDGPFVGMKILPQTTWGGGDLPAMLLGFYEQELHGAMERLKSADIALVINIGSADGYYAVGLARFLQGARVIASDTNEKCQGICIENAKANGVADRIAVHGETTAQELNAWISQPNKTVIFADCEGAEKDILDPLKAPVLTRATMIVECHDFMDAEITPTLMNRFSPTHRISKIDQGGRNPHKSPLLAGLQEFDRWIAVHEGRPKAMHWLIMQPNSA